MRRRRFLTLTAAFACAPHLVRAETWRGHALGAEVSLTLTGPRAETRAAFQALPTWLEEIEGLFSLYRDSKLVRLNANGFARVPPLFRRLMDEADRAHRVTDGRFDPTIQPVWRALAEGRDDRAARQAIGWGRVVREGRRVSLSAGQALTFNGIAQGFATDLVADRLKARGFDEALIQIGEERALGGPYRLMVADPDHGPVGTQTLHGMAQATSSPSAMRLGTQSHILCPVGQMPLWSTVSIAAQSATQADALSTAAVFMERARLKQLKRDAGLISVTLVDANGNVETL